MRLEWLTDSVKEGKNLVEEQYLQYDDGGVSNGEPVRPDPKKRKGDESEEQIANTIKKPRTRGQKTDAKAKSPVDQDVVMDEPAERAGIEEEPGRRDGLKTEAAPEPVKVELNKRGRATDQVIEPSPTVQNLEVKETEPVEPAKKGGRRTRNAAQLGPEIEDTEMKDAGLIPNRKMETKKRGGSKKESIEAESESESEPETAIDTKKSPTKETDSENAQFSVKPGESRMTLAKAKNIPVAPWCEEKCINSHTPSLQNQAIS